MNTSQKMFLLAVEEMSFTKAAKRAYITQQALSDHIRKLEQEYQASLFERKPHLALTPAGLALHKNLLEIQLLENNIRTEIQDISGGIRGDLKLGINSSRAQNMLPDIFSDYHRQFPHVTCSIYSDDTDALSRLLAKGNLDLFIGVNATTNQEFHAIPVTNDRVFLIISKGLIRKLGLDLSEKEIYYRKNGVPADVLGKLPVVQNYSISTLNQMIETYADFHGIRLNPILRVSNYSTQLGLCSLQQAAAFFPSFMIPDVLRYNAASAPEESLCIFSLEGLTETLRINCIYRKNAYLPFYMTRFIELFREHSCRYQQQVSDALPELYNQGLI